MLIEGAGTMELTATGGGGLRRMDVKKRSRVCASLAHFPAQAAFRITSRPARHPPCALASLRFPDGSVLAAVTGSTVFTTMVTSEGKSLTEVKPSSTRRDQFLKRRLLPAGVSILSAEVGGEHVKPVQGPDGGSRVPLLRPGFRPTGCVTGSFVFMRSRRSVREKGGAELSLPKMDIPISLVSWEVFLPEQYKVKDFGGDVISANLVPPAFRAETVALQSDENREVTLAGNVSMGALCTERIVDRNALATSEIKTASSA